MIHAEKAIQRLIEGTKDNSIIWYYLDTYKDIYDISVNMLLKQSISYRQIEDNTSFYCKINNGYFVLITYKSISGLPFIYLFIIPSLDSRDNAMLNSYDEYQPELLRLSNLISKQFPNVEDFLNDFLS